MALGGGTFTAQNKKLPGAYINFVSAASASAALSERGVATMPLELDWGIEDAVFEVSAADFQTNSLKLFGYDYTHDKLKGLRDLFLNIRTLYAYRVNGGGTKASNEYAEARYGGVRGNDIKITIQQNADDDDLYDVQTILGTAVVDTQTVAAASALVANDYVSFKSDASLTVTASAPLLGGTNKTVDGTAYQAYLDKIESYSYNAMGVPVTDDTTKTLFASFCKRMRDDVGVKFQLVLQGKAADYIGVVNVKNTVTDDNWNAASLVYWVTGIIAGCAINKSNQNKVYDGEFTVGADYTQSALEAAIDAGEFVLHRVGSDLRVLMDINSMVTTSDTQGEIYKDNQTIRVIDQIANDIAVLFTEKYLGLVANDEAGRLSLWADIVKLYQQLADMRAITDFTDTDISVTAGETKKSVVVSNAVTVTGAMDKLYMTVTVA